MCQFYVHITKFPKRKTKTTTSLTDMTLRSCATPTTVTTTAFSLQRKLVVLVLLLLLIIGNMRSSNINNGMEFNDYFVGGSNRENTTLERSSRKDGNVRDRNISSNMNNTTIGSNEMNGNFQQIQRRNSISTTTKMEAMYDPLSDAYCFNEGYVPPKTLLSNIKTHYSMYLLYRKVFNKVQHLEYLDVSEQDNNVTNQRIPGMFLRMCFHDNAVNDTEIDFQQYIAQSMRRSSGFGSGNSTSSTSNTGYQEWIGVSKTLTTSGADASVLLCPEERHHPNQNFDQTATRILRRIQLLFKQKTTNNNHTMFNTIYRNLSYADILHNGCNAAVIYLTKIDPIQSLTMNPFTFGRRDACYRSRRPPPPATKGSMQHQRQSSTNYRYPLCGPSDFLPSEFLSLDETLSWFANRGMSICTFMGLMWTHTTVANMATMCPIQHLTCTTTQTDVLSIQPKDKRYFSKGDSLDYFNFFLNRGTHDLNFVSSDNHCHWNVNGTNTYWPLTAIDCTLGIQNIIPTMDQNQKQLYNTIKGFVHEPTKYHRIHILQCGLQILGGKGTKEQDGACRHVIPTNCQSKPNHKFGGYYNQL